MTFRKWGVLLRMPVHQLFLAEHAAEQSLLSAEAARRIMGKKTAKLKKSIWTNTLTKWKVLVLPVQTAFLSQTIFFTSSFTRLHLQTVCAVLCRLCTLWKNRHVGISKVNGYSQSFLFTMAPHYQVFLGDNKVGYSNEWCWETLRRKECTWQAGKQNKAAEEKQSNQKSTHRGAQFVLSYGLI